MGWSVLVNASTLVVLTTLARAIGVEFGNRPMRGASFERKGYSPRHPKGANLKMRRLVSNGNLTNWYGRCSSGNHWNNG